MGHRLRPGGCGYNGGHSTEDFMFTLLTYVVVAVASFFAWVLVYRKNAATLEPVIDEVKKDIGA